MLTQLTKSQKHTPLMARAVHVWLLQMESSLIFQSERDFVRQQPR